MCFSAAHSLGAASLCTVMTLTLPRYFAPQKAAIYTMHGAFWTSMEWLQFIGYMYPDSRVVAYALMVHVVVQPVAIMCAACVVKHPSAGRGLRAHADLLLIGTVGAVLILARMLVGSVMLPCADSFCSLYGDPTPRCVIMPPNHMTWSVPLRLLPTGLYGTLHHATYHFLFFIIATCVISPVCGMLTAMSTAVSYYVTGAPRDWEVLSVWASIWCLIGVVLTMGLPVLDMIMRRSESELELYVTDKASALRRAKKKMLRIE